MPGPRSSRGSNDCRGRSRGRDDDIVTTPPPGHAVNRAGSSRDDMQVDHCLVRDARLTKWRTVSFTIRGGLRVDVPVEQINAYDVTDLRADVLVSKWPFNWCEQKI